tara:strand:- start:511 stop:741 length:231 start_codon:yes stop_codon:yes gene_type:complete
MNFGLIVYAVIGMIYAKLENDTFDIEFGDAPRYQIVLGMTQLGLHYFRIALVWPIYLCEDLIMAVDSIVAAREEDE